MDGDIERGGKAHGRGRDGQTHPFPYAACLLHRIVLRSRVPVVDRTEGETSVNEFIELREPQAGVRSMSRARRA